jgi:CheY-like chemotaxis protein
MMVYYVEKNTDIWNRVEPLIIELLTPANCDNAVTKVAPSRKSPGIDSNFAPSTARNDQDDRLLDAVFAMLGDSSEASSAATTDAEFADGESEPPWVLCIDDDPDFSDALKCRLESYGVAVNRAFSGMAGYRLAFTYPASVILLDYHLPNGQGDYILRRLKESPATREIPVIVVTGVRDKALERKMYGLGASGFLTKPVQFESLREQLARFMNILLEPAAM